MRPVGLEELAHPEEVPARVAADAGVASREIGGELVDDAVAPRGLDGAVLAAVADAVCTSERAALLARRHEWSSATWVVRSGRELILADHDLGRTCALHLIDNVEVHGEPRRDRPEGCGCEKEVATPAPPE